MRTAMEQRKLTATQLSTKSVYFRRVKVMIADYVRSTNNTWRVSVLTSRKQEIVGGDSEVGE